MSVFIRDSIGALQTSQVAYPVGPNRDAYTLSSWFSQNVDTQVITVEHQVIINHSSDSKRKTLFTGTAKECQQFIIDAVVEEEKKGKWIRNEKTWKDEYILNNK